VRSHSDAGKCKRDGELAERAGHTVLKRHSLSPLSTGLGASALGPIPCGWLLGGYACFCLPGPSCACLYLLVSVCAACRRRDPARRVALFEKILHDEKSVVTW
jgi:hypothetical protein